MRYSNVALTTVAAPFRPQRDARTARAGGVENRDRATASKNGILAGPAASACGL